MSIDGANRNVVQCLQGEESPASSSSGRVSGGPPEEY